MFVRRQDVIDSFDSNFREMEDGTILFQPPRAEVGVPVTWEEYHAVMAAFETRHMINMAITWALLAAGGAFGLYHVLAEDRYLPFFIGVGAATLLSFLLHLRDGTGLLLPFLERRDQLLNGQPTASINHSG